MVLFCFFDLAFAFLFLVTFLGFLKTSLILKKGKASDSVEQNPLESCVGTDFMYLLFMCNSLMPKSMNFLYEKSRSSLVGT